MAGLFGTGSDLLWWQECARGVLVFAYGLLAVRLAGRRVFGKWGALDIIVSIIVGSNLSRVITGTAAVVGTLLVTTLLLALHRVLSKAAAHKRWFSRLVEGAPIELGRDGRVEPGQLRAATVSTNDLEEALRQAGVETVERTRLLMLEPSGKITVLKTEQR